MPELEELMNGADAAEYLGVTRARLYAIARTGKIGRQVGGYWMFTKQELDQWKADRNPKGGRPKSVDLIPTPVIRAVV